MTKTFRHPPEKRASLKALGVRVRYIADSGHRNHVNKLVLPSRNHRCPGEGADDFFIGIKLGIARYRARRDGKRGKRTNRIWGEYCYSSEEGTVPKPEGTGMEPCLNAEEREKVERALLEGPFGRGSCRHAWHIDLVTGRCDWHCLAGEHDAAGIIWTNDGFGKGKKCLKLELERIEEKLLVELNMRRPFERRLKTARQRHKENRRKAGKQTFAQRLAAGKWDGTPETLTEAAEQAGYVVDVQTAKSITVHFSEFKKAPKMIPYNIPTLTRNWAKEKAKLRSKKRQKPDDPEVSEPEL